MEPCEEAASSQGPLPSALPGRPARGPARPSPVPRQQPPPAPEASCCSFCSLCMARRVAPSTGRATSRKASLHDPGDGVGGQWQITGSERGRWLRINGSVGGRWKCHVSLHGRRDGFGGQKADQRQCGGRWWRLVQSRPPCTAQCKGPTAVRGSAQNARRVLRARARLKGPGQSKPR